MLTYENHANDSRIREDDTPCLTARCGTGGGNLPLVQEPVVAIEGNGARPSHKGSGYNVDGAQFTLNHTEVHAVATRSSVRRITPVEAERLMGFPDNWTQIPWRGKPAEECPDGPRYKCCGNSIGVNVTRWIGMRIERVERIMNNGN